MIKQFIEAEVKAVDSEGSFEFVASSGKMDRMGDTINPKGWYLTNYKKNPVILWSHSTGGLVNAIPPVGRADKVWIEDGKELKIKGHFADTPFAQELKALVEGGFLNAVSVGFLPLVPDEKGNIEIEEKNYRRATDSEIKKGIYSDEYGEKFTKQELLEVSWVSVPALPQALVSARKMNLELVTKALEEKIEEEKEEDRLTNIEATLATIEEAIVVLKGENPDKGDTSNENIKGRKPSIKKKSKRSEMERMLIIFDKMCEMLLRKLRQ